LETDAVRNSLLAMGTETMLRRVVGIQVEPPSRERMVRIKLSLENGEVFFADIPLPLATRLTDQLVDAEFNERCPLKLFPLSATERSSSL
jgi:hypothetical protein